MQPALKEDGILDESTNYGFIKTIRKALWIAYFASALFQTIFFSELTNLAVVAMIGVGWLLYSGMFLRGTLFRAFTFSSFVLFGFATTHILFPLVFTTMEGKPVTYNLEYPEQVFLHSLAALVVLFFSFAIYRILAERTYQKSFSIMEAAGFFTPPSDLQLWIMGSIGAASMYYVFFAAPDVGRSVTGSPIDKLIQSLMPLTYAPYLMLCGPLYGRRATNVTRHLVPLAIFTAALFALSLGRSSTGAFMFGFTSVAFAYLVGAIVGIFRPKFFTFKNAILAVLGIWLLVGPLADLRTAMVIVRGEKTEIPAEILLLRTLEAYNDKEAIRQRRADDAGAGILDPDWDERYLDNVFTARFANVKFNDLSLGRAAVLDEYDPAMLDFAYSYFIGSLPDPVIKFFNFDVDKEFAYSISVGDFIYLNTGGQGTPEGFRVGHWAGIGMATYGYWYLAILGVGMIPVFYLFDKFQGRKRPSQELGKNGEAKSRYSFCGLLALTTTFQFLQFESVTMIGVFLIRGWLQIVFLYMIVYHLSRIINGVNLRRFKWSSAT